MPPTNELRFYLLGKACVTNSVSDLTEQIPAKALALVAYLAVVRQPVTRSKLAGLLWGDLPEASARANLRLTLSRAQKQLGDCLLATGQSIRLNFESRCWLDLIDFESHAARPQRADPEKLRAAVELYQGELLDGFVVRDAPDFESWLLGERERLQRMAVNSLEFLAGRVNKQED